MPPPPPALDFPQRDRARAGSRSAHSQRHDDASESTPGDAGAVFPADNEVPEPAQPGLPNRTQLCSTLFHSVPLWTAAARPPSVRRWDEGTTAPGSPCGGVPPDWETPVEATAPQEMARRWRRARRSSPRAATSCAGRRVGRPRGRVTGWCPQSGVPPGPSGPLRRRRHQDGIRVAGHCRRPPIATLCPCPSGST